MSKLDGIPCDNFTTEDLKDERYLFETDNIDHLYDFHVAFERGFGLEYDEIMSKEEFINEIKKGYGESDFLQCSRIVTHKTGFYYDQEFCM